MTQTILYKIEVDSEDFQRGLRGSAEDLKKLGTQLEDSTEHVHKFRAGVDDVVEQLNIMGDAGAQLVGEINKIRDPVKRLTLANEVMATKTNALGTALVDVSERLTVWKTKMAASLGGVENFNLVAGAAVLGVGALATGIGALGAKLVQVAGVSLQAYIKANERATKVQADFEATAARTSKTLGELIYKYTEVERLSRSAEVGVALLDGTLGRASKDAKLLDEGLALLTVGLTAVQPQMAGLVTQIHLFTQITDKAYKGVDLAAQQLQIFERVMRGVDAAAKGASAGGMASFTLAVNNQSDALRVLQASLRGVGDTLDEVARKASNATPYLTGLEAGEATGASQARAGLRRGGGGRTRAPFGSQADSVVNQPTAQVQQRRADAARTALGAGTDVGGGVGGAGLEQITQAGGGAVSTLDAVNERLGAMQSAMRDGVEASGAFKASLLETGLAAAQSFAQLLGSGASVKEFFASVLQATGAWAIQTGGALIAAGLGWSAIPGFQASASAVPAGAALVTAGLAMVGGGAYLGRQGGAQGGGGARASSGFSGASVPAPSGSQARTRTPQNTNLILILDGQEVGRALAPRLEDLAQLGHLRLTPQGA